MAWCRQGGGVNLLCIRNCNVQLCIELLNDNWPYCNMMWMMCSLCVLYCDCGVSAWWLSENSQPWQCKDWSVLWAEEIRLQEEIAISTDCVGVDFSGRRFLCLVFVKDCLLLLKMFIVYGTSLHMTFCTQLLPQPVWTLTCFSNRPGQALWLDHYRCAICAVCTHLTLDLSYPVSKTYRRQSYLAASLLWIFSNHTNGF